MIIYLAGGMKDGWQDRLIPLLRGHTILDPRSWDCPDPKVYTERDLSAVRSADCVIAYMSPANPSGFGMSIEIGYAYALGKRIIFCDSLGDDWRARYFGMHRCVSEVVASIEHAVELLK